jgi:hypothetical protein
VAGRDGPVDELHEFLQTPEAALAEAEDDLHDRVVGAPLLKLVLHVLQHHSDHLDYCDDQRSKGEGPQVVPGTGESWEESHLKVLPKLERMGMEGTSDLWRTQYQEEKAPASTISPRAETKQRPQNSMNTL